MCAIFKTYRKRRKNEPPREIDPVTSTSQEHEKINGRDKHHRLKETRDLTTEYHV